MAFFILSGNLEFCVNKYKSYAEKRRVMNIKENFYIYLYVKSNLLIQEQKADEIATTDDTTHAHISTDNIKQIHAPHHFNHL
jgi:hypothetical protein